MQEYFICYAELLSHWIYGGFLMFLFQSQWKNSCSLTWPLQLLIIMVKLAAGPVTPVSSASTKLKTMSYWPHALVAIGGLAILGTGTLCFKVFLVILAFILKFL